MAKSRGTTHGVLARRLVQESLIDSVRDKEESLLVELEYIYNCAVKVKKKVRLSSEEKSRLSRFFQKRDADTLEEQARVLNRVGERIRIIRGWLEEEE